jgi:hypothetical protein
MEEIKRQVSRARRRLILQQFVSVVVWSLFAALLIAAIGLATPKIWALSLDQQIWLASWIGGGVALGLLVAAIWTYAIRRSAHDAALEIDLRYGLRERISSTLALTPEERETEAGRALMHDAVRRVERIDVREQFRVAPNWRLVLPLVPALVIVGLLFVPDAAATRAQASATQQAEQKKVVKKAAEKLQQKLGEKAKQAEEDGLKDADLLKEMNKELNKLSSKEGADRKNALIKINDLQKEVEKRKTELGGADKLRKELDKLGKIEKGPAEALTKAMKEGDFGKAKEELEKIKDDLKNGKLDKEQKEKMAEQLEQVQQKMQQLKEAQVEARKQLEREIDKKIDEGNLGEAARMQQQLNEMQQQAKQMDQVMDKLGDKLAQAAQALKEGEGKMQEQALDQLAGDLEQLQEQLERLENLDELQDELADAKNAMNCEQCKGAGCKACEGNGRGDKKGQGQGKGDGIGDGLGEGQGKGDRPEEEGDTSFFDSRVAGDPKAGESVRVGDAGGKNIAGRTAAEVRQEIQESIKKRESDPIQEQALPRDQRENARQFFERFNKGEVE